MSDAVFALNAGSSSLKFGLFALSDDGLTTVAEGKIEGIGKVPAFHVADAEGQTLVDRRDWPADTTHEALLASTLDWIDDHLGDATLVGVGHRVVHGGRTFVEPTRLTDEVLKQLDALTPLAPLHQPHSLAPVRIIEKLRPGLPQIACFDTAFHHGLAPPVARYALPRRYEDEGIRRYGFHGISYAYIAEALKDRTPITACGRVIVAHLGNGASLCAMRDGRSVDTTMGFTALDGLVMGTRCGAIDPGILLYLQDENGLSSKEVAQLLYHESGLLGVSGLSGDVRELEQSTDPRAREALDLFSFRVARETGALTSTLGGLDAFVFTGGIGEHAYSVRANICQRLAWLGLDLDPTANEAGQAKISGPKSTVEIWMIPTNEELIVARAAATLRT